MSCNKTLSMCVVIALTFFFLTNLHAARIGQHAAERPVWVLLTAGSTLQLGRHIQKLHLTMVRAMRFHTLVPRFSVGPPTYSATIRWRLPRTRRHWFLSIMQRVRQIFLASAGGFGLDRVPLSLFHGLPFLWHSCHHFSCLSNLGTGTRHWCLE